MDSVLEQIGEWLKELLVSAIMNQLTGLFDSVNTQVGDIATQVGTTPANFSPGVFAMIRNVSESVIIPIAGLILTFIACYELIQMIIDHNNLVGISREDIVYALDAIQNPMSLYEPIFTDGGDTLYVMDQIRDKKNREENWVEHLSLSDALKKLNAREHEIISLRFFEGKTQMEVAELIGISQAQVSRLEKNALRIMRAYLSA